VCAAVEAAFEAVTVVAALPPLSADTDLSLPPGSADRPADGGALSVTVTGGAAAPPPPLEWPEIPGYEILGLLGTGGMGIVLKARQVALKRLVALKMIRAGFATDPERLARFRSEAEILGRLRHPNIVQVYDVGVHAGQPYCALELVEGGSLAEAVAGVPQPAADAARIVEVLAGAMHVAHVSGVLHRDLKPANVLLVRGGVVSGESSLGTTHHAPRTTHLKITDFGLAKQLDEDDGQTQSGAVLGTPSYMAPEQARGETRRLGPAADVYALGAILYDLLTGRPPFRGEGVLDTLEQVRSREPVPPRKLRARLPRDLETICLKCLVKDPARRYGSALELAEDLHRFRSGEPIRARPVGTLEAFAKWARRRPAVAALLLALALALVAGLAGSLWYNARLRAARDRAEVNFGRARRAVEAMLTDVGQEQLAHAPGFEAKRRALLEKALAFYEELLADRGDAPGLEWDTAEAAQRVGDIRKLLGRHAEAADSYAGAIDRWQALAADRRARGHLADCHNDRGEALRLDSRATEARAEYAEARRIAADLVAEDADPDDRMRLARVAYNLGILDRQARRLADADGELRASIAVLDGLRGPSPERLDYRQHLARAYLNHATVLRPRGNLAGARKEEERAIALLEGLAAERPDVPEYRHELGVAYNNQGHVLVANRELWQAAADQHRLAVDIFRTLVGDFPQVPAYRAELVNCRNSLGSVLARLKKYAEADEQWAAALVQVERLIQDFPEAKNYHADRGMLLANVGWLRTEQDRWREAPGILKEAIAEVRFALRPAGDADGLATLHNAYQTLTETRLHLKDHAAAVEAAAALAALGPDRGPELYKAACFVARSIPLALEDGTLSKGERRARARRYGDRAVQLLGRTVRSGYNKPPTWTQDRKRIFAPLAGRADFQRLVAGLNESAARPAAAAPQSPGRAPRSGGR
jgi:tetratricopeptide (TPR) repeat protein